jgi:uncharacterized membrane protein YkvA (DUF1232 family)
MWWQTLVGLVGGLLLLWMVLVVMLWRVQRDLGQPSSLTSALRLLPDVIRLLHRLVSDPALPRRVRIVLALLLGYLLSPIDLIPDFVPVVGYADDAIIAAIAIRSAVRHAGPNGLARHWPGTPEGLTVLTRLAGVAEAGPR